MDTKTLIKDKGLELFNSRGILNVTLRDIAKELDKSYGNITYHYKTKEHLITELYREMLEELSLISNGILQSKDLFRTILEAPSFTFDLSMKYLFLFKDFIEIRRNFPAIAKEMDLKNEAGKKRLKHTLLMLRTEEILRKDTDDEDLDYLMELSGAMRTFFFLNLQKGDFKKKNLKVTYVNYINRLISPYLAAKGKKQYAAFNSAV